MGFASIFTSQLLRQFVPILASPALIAFLCIHFFRVLLTYKSRMLITSLILFSTITILMISSSLMGYSDYISNIKSLYFYVSIIYGFLFAIYYTEYLSLVKMLLFVNLIAMCYEWYNLEFILLPTSDLDHFYGRAKGFISYSKAAGAFVLAFTLLHAKSIKVSWFPVLIASSFLTGSRMAMTFVIICIAMEVLRRLASAKSTKIENVMLHCVLLISIVVFFYVFSLQSQSDVLINRLPSTFSVVKGANVERIHYWNEHLRIYDDLPWIHKLLGYPTYATKVIGNGAENSYLNLLNDGGIISLFLYSIGILIAFLLGQFNLSSIAYLILFLICMQISRFGLGFIDGTMLWVVFWYKINTYIGSNDQSCNNL